MIGSSSFLLDGDSAPVAHENRDQEGNALVGDHGCWPYVLPYMAFLLLVQLRGTSLAFSAALNSIVEAAIPLLMIGYFFSAGAYPELQRPRAISLGLLADATLGVVSGLAWMLPYILIPSLQPTDAAGGSIGLQSTPSDWLARGMTIVIAVPLIEELFIRSFVMRWAEVLGTDGSFKTVPIATYTLLSFWTTVVFFTVAHQTWEWWVAVPWIIATNFWFYYRKSLWSVIVVHAFANLTLLLVVILASKFLTDADGQAISLWFFI